MNGYSKNCWFFMIIPGFVTDLLGIIMLLKPLRGYVWNIFFKSFNKIMEREKIKMKYY